jgi:ABC-type nitrate/sulfonate/bicarbonate transport system substrate-binding protein
MKRIFVILMVCLFLLSACNSKENDPIQQESSVDSPARKSMIFMAGYKPQANLPFVGVYVAQEEGYFEAEGVDVSIVHSAGQGEHLQLAAAGKVQVTTQDASVLLQRRASPELPLVSIALIGQQGQQSFAALSDSGFESPSDWANHLVGYKGTPPPDLFALLDVVGLTQDDIELVNVGFDPRLLTEGKVDVYPVFKSNEPFMLSQWGYDIVLWDAASYGIPTLGLTYVTSEETLNSDPDLLVRFLRAALKGIDFASKNPDEAVQIVLQYTGPETNADHMLYMLETELEDAVSEVTAQHGWGWQMESQWQALEEMLWEREALSARVDVNNAFTTEILAAALEEE